MSSDMQIPAALASGDAFDLGNGGLRSRNTRQRRRVVAAVTTLAMTAVTLGAAASSAAAQGNTKSATKTPSGSVVVFGCADPTAAVQAAGGKVTADLSLIHGVAATLPVGSTLSGCTVVADHALQVASHVVKEPTPTGPTSTARQTLGLTSKSPDGDGITVAELDTGIDNSPDLAGRVTHVDVTRTSKHSDPDDYGHGTFVAGLIAGDGTASGGAYAGAAPDARLLDVRVATDDGSTSLVSVLRGLEVVAHKQKALNIRVLNLSLSSGSPIPFQFDPLTQALESLWTHGIVVVVPAGNDGPGASTISSPGSDPVLLTVGALDESGDGTRVNNVVADYSSRGPTDQGIAKPDLVAPGSHLISLRAPGSIVDAANPDSRIGDTYFRGSGTSMSTAMTSGVVADLLSVRPELTPDQVKAIVTRSTYSVSGLADPNAAGSGGLNAAAAFTAATPVVTPVQPLDWPKGQDETFDRFSAALLNGDRAAAYYWWQKLSPAARSWTARSWTALSPAARSWVARSWTGRSWTGADGTADEWLARSWVARSWTARSWTDEVWSGRSWTGRSWTGRSWTGRSWTARSWTDDDFTARSWTARSWTARSWATVDWS